MRVIGGNINCHYFWQFKMVLDDSLRIIASNEECLNHGFKSLPSATGSSNISLRPVKAICDGQVDSAIFQLSAPCQQWGDGSIVKAASSLWPLHNRVLVVTDSWAPLPPQDGARFCSPSLWCPGSAWFRTKFGVGPWFRTRPAHTVQLMHWQHRDWQQGRVVAG